MRIFIGGLLGTAALLLGGCQQISKEPSGFDTKSLVTTRTDNTKPEAIPGCSEDDTKTALTRNSCIEYVKTQIDEGFNKFQGEMLVGTGVANLFADSVSLGLSGAGTLLPGATLKSILSAANSAVTGFKSAADADILLNQTMPILFSQMASDRSIVATQISVSMKREFPTEANWQPDATYSMRQAREDLVAYYNAGTLTHALVALSSNVNKNTPANTPTTNTAAAAAPGH